MLSNFTRHSAHFPLLQRYQAAITLKKRFCYLYIIKLNLLPERETLKQFLNKGYCPLYFSLVCCPSRAMQQQLDGTAIKTKSEELSQLNTFDKVSLEQKKSLIS